MKFELDDGSRWVEHVNGLEGIVCTCSLDSCLPILRILQLLRHHDLWKMAHLERFARDWAKKIKKESIHF